MHTETNYHEAGGLHQYIICANQAIVRRYKNLKTKLYICNSNIFFKCKGGYVLPYGTSFLYSFMFLYNGLTVTYT
jgi:hypothetical protein